MIKVIKDGMQTLSNLTKEEKDFIRTELTLPNPAYEQVKKFSRYNYTTVPPYLTYYYSIDGNLVVPRGYNIPFKHEVIKDNRVEVFTNYPKFKLSLREAQREAFENWNETREKGMIVLQTGKGKSILGIFLGYITRQKTLIIVQKNDLVDGWTKDIELCLGIKKNDVGLIKAKSRVIGEQYTIATIQTLNRLTEKELRELYDTFGMIIVDEVHHVSAKSYGILKYFRAKYFIGLTATDLRGDGLGKVMYWMIGDVCYRSPEEEDDEDIMPYKVIIKDSNIEYNPPTMYYYGSQLVDEDTANQLMQAGKSVKRKSLDPQVLKSLLKDDEFNELVAEDIYKEYSAKKSCIVFIHEKEHIRDMRDRLIKKGVLKSKIQLYYGDAKEDDSVMKERAESKEVLITIATFSKATEGTNVKAWERAFLVTSLNDLKNTIQAVGRIRRRKEGKKDCIVYTYAHPKVKGMRNHINTQLQAFKLNKAEIIWNNQPKNYSKSGIVLSRGFVKN